MTTALSSLRPWTDLVKLHPDVEDGKLTEAVFAIDLGAIASSDKNVPVVNRDPDEFFRATYPTADLRRLLQEVLGSLAGQAGFNRVLKLRTPFGGGKSHTLAALLHAARSRKSLNQIAECRSYPDPGRVDVAVFDGEKFTATGGKEVEGGRSVNTMWGWLAWQIGEKAYKIVEKHDQDRVAPAGDEIRAVLAANGRPVLVLLDEVLKYMERGAAVAVLDSTLRRQAMDFFHNLTVEIANSPNAALVFSLQWSAREAFQNVALLNELDGYARRVDQLREPVTGDEILPILQRRLLASEPDPSVAEEVARAYQTVITGMQRAEAEGEHGRRQAEEDGLLLLDRMKRAYPFHPALIDLMKERWASIDGFQRTRGALRFLASCLHGLKQGGGAKPLLGPAEIPLRDVDVRVKMLKELGAQNEFDAVIASDVDGPNARARRIDDRIARETPALSAVRPATRIATAILAYSFGGLRREGGSDAETLPPGVTEADLLAASVGPDLDNITAKAALAELRTSCLYLHYDGVRYCFKKDPNVTKLVEDSEQEIARRPTEVNDKIKEMLQERLSGARSAIVWPEKSSDIDDKVPTFLVGYLPLDFATKPKAEQEQTARAVFGNYGDRPRTYRNGIGLAIPDKKQVEALRRAVRYLLAVGQVEAKKTQHRLTQDQLEQLRERKRTESAAAETALRGLYASIWLPRMESGQIDIERVEAGGRPLQATGVHERMWELLTHMTSKVFTSTTPRKVAELMRLGQSAGSGEAPRLGIRVADVRDAFYGSLGYPRLDGAAALQKAIAKGIADSQFAFTSGAQPALGADGRFEISYDRVVSGRTISDDEVDLESGFLIAQSAVPAPPPALTPSGAGQPPASTDPGEPVVAAPPGLTIPPPAVSTPKMVTLRFAATREQVFKAFPAIANLADKADSGKIRISVEAANAAGFDPNWLRNAVHEPLDEANVERESS